MSPELVVLGNLLVDDLVLADGRTRMGEAGGAVLHAALGAGLWGTRVGCVSLRGDDYPGAALAALAARGVDLTGVRALGRPGLRTWLLYEPAGRRMVPRLHGPTHEAVSPGPAQVPPGWARARAFHLAPMPFCCQQSLVAALGEEGGFVSLDPHLPVTESTLEGWRALLRGVDALFLSEEDLQLPGADAAATIGRLASPRLRHVALKRGARGGTLYDLREGRAEPWAARAGPRVDPTGAGDAFAAAFASAIAHGLGAETALQRGVVAASFAVADWGAAGLLAATPAAAQERLRDWFPGDAGEGVRAARG